MSGAVVFDAAMFAAIWIGLPLLVMIIRGRR